MPENLISLAGLERHRRHRFRRTASPFETEAVPIARRHVPIKKYEEIGVFRVLPYARGDRRRIDAMSAPSHAARNIGHANFARRAGTLRGTWRSRSGHNVGTGIAY